MEKSELVAERLPLLHATMPNIAHPQILNRGTFGGSLAHADPASELPAVTLAMKARFRARSPGGERWIDAEDFFVGLFETALEDDEILVEVALPALPAGSGWGFHEIARRNGDYALVGAAAVVRLKRGLTGRQRCKEARLTFLSVGEKPVAASRAVAALEGRELTEDVIRAAAETAASEDIEAASDIHASEAYRRHLSRVVAAKVLTEAAERARG